MFAVSVQPHQVFNGRPLSYVAKRPSFGYHRNMSTPELPPVLAGARVHLVGIKGTGMCALAELLHRAGSRVTGSDTTDVFYTDEILKALALPYTEGFDARNLPSDTELVIHSAAYSAETNPELAEALRRNLPILKYTDALGSFSGRFDSSGIAGVHGKTTTTAIAGTLIRAASLPAQILAGSAVGDFGGRSTLSLGDRYFVAETCEYRRHFLAFKPRRIVLTSVESDHQDYYPTYESIREAFVEYALKLPSGGELIYCADDEGASEVAAIVASSRSDLLLTPYGLSAEGPFRIESIQMAEERTIVRVSGFPGELRLRVPGRHVALDAVAAIALVSSLLRAERRRETDADGWTVNTREAVRRALEGFRGSRRRSEIVGEADGILVMDDYAHHPTAIRTTLEGLKAFYPKRRLVVSFMSHTYTRTAALLDEFAAAFGAADEVIFHKIYGSARERYEGGVTGRTLYERAAPLCHAARYVEEPLDAADELCEELRPGDLLLTMGAGDNWRLGKAVLEKLEAGTRRAE
jgi:UDP-N-acetylmuramate--alanine ligase